MTSPDPKESARAFFAYHLKRQRKIRNMSQEQLAAEVHCSPSLISGFENCLRTPGPGLSKAFDTYFDLSLFFEAVQPRIVEETGLPAGFPEYADTEAEATVMKFYENFVITGLFQTPGYARAVLQAGQRLDKLESRVATRMGRQELLGRDDPPMIIALIDEYALRRRFGDREVMRDQYGHLLKLVSGPKIALHIVPADAGLCPEGAFTILSFLGSADIGYAESAGGRGQLIEADGHVNELDVLFELIRNKALSDTGSEKMICDLLEEL